MLKKLKIKFILTNMFLVGVVVVATFSALCLLIYANEEAKLTNRLTEDIAIMTNSPIPFRPQLRDELEGISYQTELVILLDKDGNVITATEHDIDKNTLSDAIAIILENQYERGNLHDLKLSFLRQEKGNNTIVSLVSREYLEDRVYESTSQCAIAAIVAFFLFLFISARLANIAIAPVEKAWEQQKQFLADASHDLKTPLTVILANNNIISSHKEETVDSQMKWIESTSEEATRMSDLVNKMLELAKSEAAREELKLGESSISDLVENSILQFEVVAFEKGITIESDIDPYVIGRTHRATFSKVLEILFDNAIKYSNENGKIYVTLSQTSKRIIFTITNHGEHIKEEDIPYIFERFYRSNKERKVGGHGLGLSLAKKKCDMIGAKLSVMSDEINGTTFTISMKSNRKSKVR